MRRYPLSACTVAVVLVALLPAAATAAMLGGDPVTAEAPPVGPFSRVEVNGHAEVVLVQGNREAVVIEASPKSQSRIRVRSSEGNLTIDVGERRTGWWFGASGRPPTITVHFRTLESLSVSGAVKVRADSIDTPKLRVRASGAASMTVDALTTDMLRFSGTGAVKGEFAGRATEQEIAISGAGSFRAPKLRSDNADVSVSGAGRVVVHAERKLDARISGAGAIDYYGSPEVKQRVSGAGKITRRSSGGVEPARMRLAAGATGMPTAPWCGERGESSPA